MSKKKTRFIDLYLAGRVSPEDINDSIDAWHAGSGREPIYDHLGMTEEEYATWLRDPYVLPNIARARKENRPLSVIMASKESPITIRPLRARKAEKIKRPHKLGKIG